MVTIFLGAYKRVKKCLSLIIKGFYFLSKRKYLLRLRTRLPRNWEVLPIF